MRYIAASILLLSMQAVAQDFSSVLQSIERNSPRLGALRTEADADKVASRLDYLPDGPDLSVGYLFGVDASGAKADISLQQVLDMPTTHVAKRRMAREVARVADLRYLDERRQYLLTARKLCIEVVFCNAMMEHLSEDLTKTRTMCDAYNTLYEQGEATSIEHNKAHQAVLLFTAEYREFFAMKENLLAELACMNGGQAVSIEDSVFVNPPVEADFNAWLQPRLDSHPTLRLSLGEVKQKEAELLVAKRQRMPALAIGAAAEIGREEKVIGPTIGLKLPAWGTQQRIKVARMRLKAKETETEDIRLRLINQLQSTHREALELQETQRQFTHHLTHCDNSELLQKSLAAGQITVLTYLQELQFVHEMHEKRLATERDLALRLAELDAFDL